MGTRIIDGKTIAADLRGKVTDAVHRLRRDRGVVPVRLTGPSYSIAPAYTFLSRVTNLQPTYR